MPFKIFKEVNKKLQNKNRNYANSLIKKLDIKIIQLTKKNNRSEV